MLKITIHDSAKELNGLISQLQTRLQEKERELQHERQEKAKYQELYERYSN